MKNQYLILPRLFFIVILSVIYLEISFFTYTVFSTSNTRFYAKATELTKAKPIIKAHNHQYHGVDLSYQTHFSFTQISDSLQRKMHHILSKQQNNIPNENSQVTNTINQHWNETLIPIQRYSNIKIDVSSSMLKDSGFQSIISTLFTILTASNITSALNDDNIMSDNQIVNVQLQSRMNKLSPQSVIVLFNAIRKGGDDFFAAISAQQQKFSSNFTSNSTNSSLVIKGNNDVNMNQEKDEMNLQDNVTHSELTEETKSLHPENNTNILEHDISNTTALNNVYISSLDLSFNDIGLNGNEIDDDDETNAKQQRLFMKSLRDLIADESCVSCPQTLRLDRCGLGPPSCRSIGKGILNSSKNILNKLNDEDPISQLIVSLQRRLRKLYLCGNEGISDGGTAAIAAALKLASRIPDSIPTLTNDINTNTSTGSKNREPLLAFLPVLDVLDLSSCNIGDIGAHALSIAIKYNTGCVHNLDLSNNIISDEGATYLGQAIISSFYDCNYTGHEKIKNEKETKPRMKRRKKKKITTPKTPIMDCINLSNNPNISDKGFSDLFKAIECKALRCLIVRSCSLREKGSIALGKSMGELIKRVDGRRSFVSCIEIDLSGNHLGSSIMNKKKGKYSATAITSTTASYMNFIGKKLKSGLRDSGMADLLGGIGSPDSDDEDSGGDIMKSLASEIEDEVDASSKCGVKQLVKAMHEIFENHDNMKNSENIDRNDPFITIKLGMRMCSLDNKDADALASIMVTALNDYGVRIIIDATLNRSLEDEVILALNGNRRYEGELMDMADRHVSIDEGMRRNDSRKNYGEDFLKDIFSDDAGDEDEYDGH